MLKIIHSSEREENLELLDNMHVLRAQVFKDRMNWAVTVKNGRERDHFDDLPCLYVLSVTSTGRVVGCLRALQTTGPNMLCDVWPQLLDGRQEIRSPLVWESTRFGVDLNYAAERSRSEISRITAELLCGLFETGRAAGLQYVVSVYDIIMERVLKRAGCFAERLGPPQDVGGVMTVAGLFEVSDEMIDRLHERSNLPYPMVAHTEFDRLGFAA